jgi:hypothetical protein
MRCYPVWLKSAFILFLVAFLLGCGTLSNLVSTATPYPTYTPFPPTATPKPDLWSVKVNSVTTAGEFGTYSPTDENMRFIILSIEYTYRGEEAVAFFPESLVLTDMTGMHIGWSRTPSLYQGDGNTNIILFTSDTVMSQISPGKTVNDIFVWIFPKDRSKFQLFFPESKALEISLEP